VRRGEALQAIIPRRPK